MKPYPTLTEDGKIQRLRLLGEEALGEFDLTVRKLTLVTKGTNTTFRVDADDRRKFALRIGPAAGGVEVHTATEIAWLRRLAGESTIAAVQPVANRDGEFITRVKRLGVPDERICVLFEWVPAQPLGRAASRFDFGMLGELAAHLHEQARRWKRRRGLHPLTWDRVFYYPNEPVVLYDGRFRRIMTDERLEIVRGVEEKANAELTRLRAEGPSFLLHGGLHPWNVLLHRGRLHVIGFEEVMLGAPVLDIAITLFHSRKLDDYDALLAAFIAGYRSIREWPVEYSGQVLLLMAARQVMLVNYLLRKGVEDEAILGPMIDEMAASQAGS